MTTGVAKPTALNGAAKPQLVLPPMDAQTQDLAKLFAELPVAQFALRAIVRERQLAEAGEQLREMSHLLEQSQEDTSNSKET